MSVRTTLLRPRPVPFKAKVNFVRAQTRGLRTLMGSMPMFSKHFDTNWYKEYQMHWHSVNCYRSYKWLLNLGKAKFSCFLNSPQVDMMYWSCLAYYIKAKAAQGQCPSKPRPGVRGQGHRFLSSICPRGLGQSSRTPSLLYINQANRFSEVVVNYGFLVYYAGCLSLQFSLNFM